MKIVLSLLNFRPGRIGGTETYLRRLIPHMVAAAGGHELTLLVSRQQEAENLFPGVDRAVVDLGAARVMAERGLEAVSKYRCRAAEKALDRLQPDVTLFPQQSIFPKNVDCPCVLVVHDLYHVRLPQYLSPQQRFYRNRSYAASIERADRIIAISEVTKQTVIDHYGVGSRRVAVVPHGIEWPANDRATSEFRNGRPYVYYPATSLPHKNHAVLFQSIARLKAEGRFPYDLILSGIHTGHWKTLRRLVRKLDLDGTVRHLGYVSYDKVQQLYRGAECILFPTTFEGFGLPVVEAFQARKKIVVSRLPIFSELGVPSQFQIDFSDPQQLDAALRLPGTTTLLRKPWTWQQTAQATLDLLVEEASGSGPCILPFHQPLRSPVPSRRGVRAA